VLWLEVIRQGVHNADLTFSALLPKKKWESWNA
jgi:hypothetical protein